MTNRHPKRILQSFAGGEMSPEMLGRFEDLRVQSGAALMQNMLCMPHGPVIRRPGWGQVAIAYGTTTNTGARNFTFRYSDNDAFCVEIGRESTGGYIRIHQNGAPITFTPNPTGVDPLTWGVKTFILATDVHIFHASPTAPHGAKFHLVDTTVTMPGGVNLGTEEFTVAAGTHDYQDGDPVGVVTDGTYPTPLGSATTYYAIRVSSTVFKLASSYTLAIAGTPINIHTSAGSGTLRVSRADYLNNGDGVRFVGVLPAPLGTTTTYFARSDGSSIGFEIYLTRDGAVDGISTELANLTAPLAYPGTLFAAGFNRRYRNGELVEHARESGDYYTCAVEHSAVSFIGSNWLQQGADNIYTIRAPWLAAELFQLDYSQSNDIMTLTHVNHDKRELRRQATNSWWELAIAVSVPTLRPPENLAATTNFGVGVEITNVGGLTSSTIDGITLSWDVPVEKNDPGSVGIAKGDRGYITAPGVTLNGNAIVDEEAIVIGIDSAAAKFYLGSIATGETWRVGAGDYDIAGSQSAAGTWRPATLSVDTVNSYVVTAVSIDGRESLGSDNATVNDVDIFHEGAAITLTWDKVDGAASYRIYKKVGSIYGLLGTVDGTEPATFVDRGEAGKIPDTSRSVPRIDSELSGTNYPRTVGYFDQRRIFAATLKTPQRVWGTAVGTESDFTYHIPLLDSDRLQFDIASREGEVIRHILGLDHLFIFTDQTEYRISPVNSDTITPTSTSVRPQSYVGSGYARPLVAGRTILLVDDNGRVHEVRYSVASDGFVPVDMSLRSQHFFDLYDIKDAALMKKPFQCGWFTSTSGKLLGFTYVPEHEVGGWHQHTSPQGNIESVCVVPEGGEDRVYVVVNDGTQRHIQRMGSFFYATLADAFFVDGGVTGSGTTITVGTHLNGQTVSILADGVVSTGTVSGGVVTLSSSATKAHVGLAYTSLLQTMPIAIRDDAFGSGEPKHISETWLRVIDSGQFEVGPELTAMNKSKAQTPTAMLNELVPVTPFGSWNLDGQIYIRQNQPLPLKVVSATLEVA